MSITCLRSVLVSVHVVRVLERSNPSLMSGDGYPVLRKEVLYPVVASTRIILLNYIIKLFVWSHIIHEHVSTAFAIIIKVAIQIVLRIPLTAKLNNWNYGTLWQMSQTPHMATNCWSINEKNLKLPVSYLQNLLLQGFDKQRKKYYKLVQWNITTCVSFIN